MRGLVITSLLLGSCTLVNAPSEHLSEPIAAGDYCRALGAELCRAHVECCSAAEPTFDIEACVTRLSSLCVESGVLEEPRVGFDPAIAGATIARAADYVDRCDDGLLHWYASPEGIYAPLTGTVDAGGVCSGDRTPTLASFFACRGDLTCRFTSTNWTCTDPVPEGDACITPFDCVEGTYCDDGVGGPGVCAERLGGGFPCDPNDANGADECASGFCFIDRCVAPEGDALFCSLGG